MSREDISRLPICPQNPKEGWNSNHIGAISEQAQREASSVFCRKRGILSSIQRILNSYRVKMPVRHVMVSHKARQLLENCSRNQYNKYLFRGLPTRANRLRCSGGLAFQGRSMAVRGMSTRPSRARFWRSSVPQCTRRNCHHKEVRGLLSQIRKCQKWRRSRTMGV